MVAPVLMPEAKLVSKPPEPLQVHTNKACNGCAALQQKPAELELEGVHMDQDRCRLRHKLRREKFQRKDKLSELAFARSIAAQRYDALCMRHISVPA